MFPFLFCLLFGIGVFAILFLSYAELPLFSILVLVSFGLLFLFCAWGFLKHHMGVLRARKAEAVDAKILVLVNNGPKSSSYYAVINIGQET